MYAAVPYSCIQPFNVPYLIKEYDVEAQVSVHFSKSTFAQLPNEAFKIILKGDDLSLEVKASKKYLILKREVLKTSRSGGQKIIEAQMNVELCEAMPILRGFQIIDLKMDQNKLTFTTKDKIPLQLLGLSLEIIRSKDTEGEGALFSRRLNQNEIEQSPEGFSGRIDLDHLGVKLPSGKYELTLKTDPRFEGNILNVSQFPELFTSKTLILKRR
jgi:hypothetical protein